MIMETSELIKKVRKIEIKTRGLSHNIFAGQYHSAFKGRGMSFSEVREYQYGDDVRDIDWNVTARFHRPFVKVYEEERELTVMLLVDVSESLAFGTIKQTKRDMLTEIAATLEGTAYVTRQSVHSVPAIRKAKKAIRKAFENSMNGKGSNLVEIVSTCNSGWKMTPEASNKWMEENMFPFYPLGDLKDKE